MRFRIGMRKKPINQLNWENKIKNKKKPINQLNWENKIKNKKSNYDKKNRLNRLEYFKKYLVRFGFGFISLKP